MTPQQQAAMRQALEALEAYQHNGSVQLFDAAVTALRQAIEQQQTGIKQVIELYDSPEQQPADEPVAKAWDEGYRTGINDERMSESTIGIAGFNAKVEPARNNPYRTRPQPADEIDWKDQYEKQKRRAEMWVAKYEKDIGPVEKAVPMRQTAEEPVATLWQHGETGRTRVTMPGDITDCDASWFKAADLYTRPQPAAPAMFGGGLVAIKTLLSRDPCAHAKVAIEMIDAMLAAAPEQKGN